MFRHTGGFSTFSVDDVPRAKQFYGGSLGLSVADEMDGLRLDLGDGVQVFVYPKADHVPATFTVLNFVVEDIDVAVAELGAVGVEFEQYDMPGVSWSDGIASIPTMGRAAWFKDSEGNIMCLDDAAGM